MSLGDQTRTAEQNGVPFLVDSEAAGILEAALNSMRLGPGKPGPGDEWKMPSGSIDEVGAQADETDEPAQSSRGGLLRRLTRRS